MQRNDRSRQGLSNEYLLFSCKDWFRYSRERALSSLPDRAMQQPEAEARCRTSSPAAAAPGGGGFSLGLSPGARACPASPSFLAGPASTSPDPGLAPSAAFAPSAPAAATFASV